MVIAIAGFGSRQSSTDSTVSGDPAAGAGSEPLVALGEQLFLQNCAACHGLDLRGTAVGPSLLSIVYEPDHHGDAAFLLAVRNGVRQHHWTFGDMPPIPGLSDTDVAAIVTYVREQQRTNGFEPYPPP